MRPAEMRDAYFVCMLFDEFLVDDAVCDVAEHA